MLKSIGEKRKKNTHTQNYSQKVNDVEMMDKMLNISQETACWSVAYSAGSPPRDPFSSSREAGDTLWEGVNTHTVSTCTYVCKQTQVARSLLRRFESFWGGSHATKGNGNERA